MVCKLVSKDSNCKFRSSDAVVLVGFEVKVSLCKRLD